MFWPFRRRSKAWPSLPAEEIKKRSRILVIDDAEFFYLDLFLRDGYTVERWPDVTDLPKLEQNYFDIILLDIVGVGRDKTKDQGLGILRHLKRVTPAQIVVAYSRADFSLKVKEFFDLADATLDKRADYVDFKRVIDQLLVSRFSLGFYLGRITGLVQSPTVDSAKLRAAAERAILTRDISRLRRLLSESGEEKETTGLILQVAQTAIGILQLIAL